MMDNNHLNINAKAFVDLWARTAADQEHSLLVTGHSMYPFLCHNRSVVFIMKKAQYRLKKGDIVLFCRNNETMVLHRIIKILKNGELLINGDAQGWTEIISKDAICAQVTRICRRHRVYSVDYLPLRLCVAIWILLLPARGFLLRAYARLRDKNKKNQA